MHPDCNAAYQRCNPMPLRIQVEHVVSAAGIARIYYYLRAGAAATADSGAATADSGAAAAAAVDAEVRAAIDPSAVVAAHGTPGEMGADPYCMAAMEAFLDALGAEKHFFLRVCGHPGSQGLCRDFVPAGPPG